MKKWILVTVLILAFGAVRLPIEQRLTEEQKRHFFRQTELDLDLRQQVGQLGFLAALSGFRSLVADILWIEAHGAWERTDWARMLLLFEAVTALQPRSLTFWDMAAWHMAWNASVAVEREQRYSREALIRRAQQEYYEIGEDLLRRGISNNPDRHLLFERLGFLYREKFQDHCRAAELYAQAGAFEEAPDYVRRMAAYELARCPGNEAEAYVLLRELYELGERQRLPTLLTLLQEMEEALGIPEEERIERPDPEEPQPVNPEI